MRNLFSWLSWPSFWLESHRGDGLLAGAGGSCGQPSARCWNRCANSSVSAHCKATPTRKPPTAKSSSGKRKARTWPPRSLRWMKLRWKPACSRRPPTPTRARPIRTSKSPNRPSLPAGIPRTGIHLQRPHPDHPGSALRRRQPDTHRPARRAGKPPPWRTWLRKSSTVPARKCRRCTRRFPSSSTLLTCTCRSKTRKADRLPQPDCGKTAGSKRRADRRKTARLCGICLSERARPAPAWMAWTN